MKVTITLNKHTIHRDIPLSWEQVTFGDFLKLDDCGQDIVKLMALFWRLDYEQLKKAKITGFDAVVAALGFLNKQMHVPEIKSIKELHGYKLPQNLEFEEVQQYLDLKACVAEAKDLTPIKQLEKYTLYCAVYACKQWKGSYSIEAAEALAPVFLNAPCTEVMAVGNFTLLRLIGLNVHTRIDSRKAVSLVKKYKLALKGWVMRTGYRLRSMIWLKRLGVK